MVEHLHEGGNIRVEHGAMDIAEGLPEGMASIIPFQVYFPAPTLDQAVQVRHTEGLPSFPGLKEKFPVASVQHCPQQTLHGLMDVLVDGHIPEFAGLLLPDTEMLSRFKTPHLAHGDPEQIARPEIGIDPQGEYRQVPWPVRQKLFDQPDILRLADWLDLDGGPLLRLVV